MMQAKRNQNVLNLLGKRVRISCDLVPKIAEELSLKIGEHGYPLFLI